MESCFDNYDAGQRSSFATYVDKLEETVKSLAAGLTACAPAIKHERRRVQGLVLCHMHHRDVVKDITQKQAEQGCVDSNGRLCFAWQKQLRYATAFKPYGHSLAHICK